jgi:hypothetical protein
MVKKPVTTVDYFGLPHETEGAELCPTKTKLDTDLSAYGVIDADERRPHENEGTFEIPA